MNVLFSVLVAIPYAEYRLWVSREYSPIYVSIHNVLLTPFPSACIFDDYTHNSLPGYVVQVPCHLSLYTFRLTVHTQRCLTWNFNFPPLHEQDLPHWPPQVEDTNFRSLLVLHTALYDCCILFEAAVHCCCIVYFLEARQYWRRRQRKAVEAVKLSRKCLFAVSLCGRGVSPCLSGRSVNDLSVLWHLQLAVHWCFVLVSYTAFKQFTCLVCSVAHGIQWEPSPTPMLSCIISAVIPPPQPPSPHVDAINWCRLLRLLHIVMMQW